MATFWKIAAHSVDHMFSKCILTILVIPVLVLRAGFGNLISSVPGLCKLFTFYSVREIQIIFVIL